MLPSGYYHATLHSLLNQTYLFRLDHVVRYLLVGFLPTTVLLVLFGIGWNLLGDGLNDLLNPRTR